VRYIIYVEQGKRGKYFEGPVAEVDAGYLQQGKQHLKRLDQNDYIHGFGGLLHLLTRYSYVLDEDRVYWCIEWDPGLIVIEFSPSGEMRWVPLRSPVPDFGGRTPLKEEQDRFDPEAPNSQVSLVFDPWSAQFDKEDRQDKAFSVADRESVQRFELALEVVNRLGEEIDARFGEDLETWVYQCEAHVQGIVGQGVRLES